MVAGAGGLRRGVDEAECARRARFKLALVGQGLFVAALAAGLVVGGLDAAGWAVSATMTLYFGWYFWRLARWPLRPAGAAEPPGAAQPPGAAGAAR